MIHRQLTDDLVEWSQRALVRPTAHFASLGPAAASHPAAWLCGNRNTQTAWRVRVHQAVSGLYNRSRRLTLRKPRARL